MSITTKRWSVDVFVDERDGSTYAEARLHTDDKTHLVGVGRARLNPADHDIPEIGDELAVARALSDLAHRLLIAAAGDIEATTHQPVRLSR
jgi:Rv2632c-like